MSSLNVGFLIICTLIEIFDQFLRMVNGSVQIKARVQGLSGWQKKACVQ